ncbi:uncharacterized protein LY89DRAFT_720592 [Mollisia scopiformis]|uniref:Wax synthase domain-containing protein n=1 Tax=Mollisia scopiformis TaxID=149040 RepID=A0A194X206_MOLSC|nr:uncharacterized protein LY89DRAFT_720592 [Mollisia scopiformis]KUJ14230.1 hypothetical protein LY89DRAFT_720592 [Mollisia scopiformis]
MEALRVPLLAQLSAHLLLHIALLIPPSTLSQKQLALSFLPAIWAINIYTWTAGFGFLAIAQSLWALELLGVRRVREEFSCLRYQRIAAKKVKIESRVEEKKTSEKQKLKEGITKEPYPSTLWPRIFWVANLICSLRYTSWQTTSSTSLPPSKPPKRIPFLTHLFLHTTLYLLLIDAISLYTHFDPYFQISTPISEPFPRRLRTFLSLYHLHHIPPQLVRILIVGGQQYAVFSLLTTIPAIFFVGLGALGVVGDFWGGTMGWRAGVGNLSLGTAVVRRGLRGFWGEGWVQYLRVILTGPGKALTKQLGLPERGLRAYSLRVVIAFGISSFLHVSTLPSSSNPAFLGLKPLRYAAFFWVQGALVVGEAVASHLLERVYPRSSRGGLAKAGLSVVRLVWVIGVMYWTAPLIVDEMTKASRAFGLRQPVLFKLPES